MDQGSSRVSGGHDNLFTCDTEKYLCPVCLLVLSNAMQTSCGHRFCQSCIDRVIGKSTMLKCPVDKQFSKLNQIFPDVAIRREVMSLPVRCSHEPCTWHGDLRDYGSHMEHCQMEEVPCPFGCHVRTRRCDVDTHVETCPSREVTCEYCSEKIQYQMIETHLSECLKVPVRCPLCQEEDILRESVDQHKDPDTGSCPEVVVKCPYQKMGCGYTCRREDMEQHVTCPDSMSSHLSILSQTLAEQEVERRDMKNMITKLVARIETMEFNVQRFDRKAEMWKKELNYRNVTGQLHWKVELRGRGGEYHSCPFYTGCPGYKVQVDFETDSSREGNCRFAGFGLTLLRGEYDDQVMWPFNATCYITILDQKVGSKPKNFVCSVVMREVPRNRNGSRMDRLFKRGMAKLIKREEIIGQGSRFVKNGCLYLEVSVVHCAYPLPEATSSPLAGLTPVSIHAIQSPHGHNPPSSPVLSLASLSVIQ